MKTIVGLFDDISEARAAVEDLRDAGLSRDDISLVARDVEERYADQLGRGARDVDAGAEDEAAEGALAGAVGGGVLGGLAGVLVGLGALTLPGVGPVVAAGPIAAGLTGAGVGAVAGGLLGALVEWGIPEEEAEYYAEGVRRGGTLVAVRAPDTMAERAADIIDRHNPVDIERRAEAWQSEGWTGYDRSADPYTAEQVRGERERYGRSTGL